MRRIALLMHHQPITLPTILPIPRQRRPHKEPLQHPFRQLQQFLALQPERMAHDKRISRDLVIAKWFRAGIEVLEPLPQVKSASVDCSGDDAAFESVLPVFADGISVAARTVRVAVGVFVGGTEVDVEGAKLGHGGDEGGECVE